MKINGYELVVVCANHDKITDTYGDIYDCVEDCKKDHPDDEIELGYYLKSNNEDIETPDWFDDIWEAFDWANSH